MEPEQRNRPYIDKERIISAQNISLTLGENEILRDVNLEISNIEFPGSGAYGQVNTLLGPSGVGKSQLARVLAGLVEAQSGEVLIGESGIPVKAGNVGVVFQNYILFEHRTVMGNLRIAARLAGVPKTEIDDRCNEMLEGFGLMSKASSYPSELSGGQRQRIAIAQQLLRQTEIIIMDEPLSGLDEGSKYDALRTIRKAANLFERNTFIVITHDRSILPISDDVWVMGHEIDEKGKALPGARIVERFDMLDLDLSEALNPHVASSPSFLGFDEKIRGLLIDLKRRADSLH